MSTIAAIETQADLLIRGGAPPNDHFLHPKPLPTMPFEMKYEDRRHLSNDPRVKKQVRDELQFENTVVRGIWHELAKYALTLNERWMDAIELERMLLAQGITNPNIRGKVCDALLDRAHQHLSVTVVKTSVPHSNQNNPNRWNAVVMCKQLEILLTDPDYQDPFITACFDRFDRPDPTRRLLSKKQIITTDLNPIEENPPLTFRWFDAIIVPESAQRFTQKGQQSTNPKVQKQIEAYLLEQRKKQLEESTFVLPDIPIPKKKLKRRRKSSSNSNSVAHPTSMRAGATLPQLEPLKAMILTGDIGNEFLPHITYDDFKKAFLLPRNAEWVATFLGPIFEALATFCSPPHGVVPLPPLPWLHQTMEIVPRAQCMADADVLLLSQLELRGGSATDPVEKPPRRKRSASSSGSKATNNNSAGSSSARNAPSSGRRGGGSSARRGGGNNAESDLSNIALPSILTNSQQPPALGTSLLSLASSLAAGGTVSSSRNNNNASISNANQSDGNSNTFITGGGAAAAAAASGGVTDENSAAANNLVASNSGVRERRSVRFVS